MYSYVKLIFRVVLFSFIFWFEAIFCCFWTYYIYPFLHGKNGQNKPENWQNSKRHYLWSQNGHFCQKCPFLWLKKWHFEEPNQNSKTTFIVQTFPKYGPSDFYFVNLSFLGAILAIIQFCWFSGLFRPISPYKIGQTLGQNSSISSWPNFVFEVIGQFFT